MSSLLFRRNEQSAAGFTLIEVLLYSALFSVIMGSMILLGYAVSQSAQTGIYDLRTQEEASFVVDKLDQLLDNNSVEIPAAGQTAGQLALVSNSTPGNFIVNLDAKRLQLQRNKGVPIPLTATGSELSDFLAHQTVDHKLTIEFRLNEEKISFFRYMFSP